jgi:hypothetical protein
MLESAPMDNLLAHWLSAPPAGDLLWEFVRPSDGIRLRCELRGAAADVWQVIVYQNGCLLAWHSGFSHRSVAERWARGTRSALAQRARSKSVRATVKTSEPPEAPPTLHCQQCAGRLEYLYSYVTHIGVRTHQWDRFRCPRGCGEFEYRPRGQRNARRLR